MASPVTSLIPTERIEQSILLIREQKVMLDRDLAKLYGVKPIALRQQVARNKERFPDDFMFQLHETEATALVSHFVIPSKQSLGGALPYVFTQEGVAMLSSVLKSNRAIQINIGIMRVFVRLRRMIATNEELARKIKAVPRPKVSRGFEHLVSSNSVWVFTPNYLKSAKRLDPLLSVTAQKKQPGNRCWTIWVSLNR